MMGGEKQTRFAFFGGTGQKRVGRGGGRGRGGKKSKKKKKKEPWLDRTDGKCLLSAMGKKEWKGKTGESRAEKREDQKSVQLKKTNTGRRTIKG